MVVDPDGPPCPCGRRGCWERYASGSGLAQLARAAAVGGRLRRVVEVAGGDAGAGARRARPGGGREGDAGRVAVIDEFARWVALGLVNLTNALDPATFVLGGGLAEGADLYLEPIQRWFTELLYAPELRPHPALAFAELGERAGAIGAAMFAGQTQRRTTSLSPPKRATMAETRTGPEDRATGGAPPRRAGAVLRRASGVAIVVASFRFWPDDLEPSTSSETARNVRLGRCSGSLALATLWFGGVGARALRCAGARARRWERMLRRSVRGRRWCRRPRPTSTPCRSNPAGSRSSPRLVGTVAARRSASSPTACWRCSTSLPLPESDDGKEEPIPSPCSSVVVLAVCGVRRRRGGRCDKWRIGRAVERPSDWTSPSRLTQLHDADISPRRARAIPPLDVINPEEPGRQWREPAADHGRGQLVRRPAAVDPVPAPVRQRAGDGSDS